MWGLADWGSMVWGGGAPVPLLGPIGLVSLVASFLVGMHWSVRRTGRGRVLRLGVLGLVALPLSAAVAVTLPHAFTNGTVADATEVNANFATLETAASDADTRIAAIESPEAKQSPVLLNGWVSSGPPAAGASFYKDGSGVVHFEGLIQDGTIGYGLPVFVLPTGYRPSGNLIFVTLSATNIARIDVLANGIVTMETNDNSYVSLSGISFRP